MNARTDSPIVPAWYDDAKYWKAALPNQLEHDPSGNMIMIPDLQKILAGATVEIRKELIRDLFKVIQANIDQIKNVDNNAKEGEFVHFPEFIEGQVHAYNIFMDLLTQMIPKSEPFKPQL